jgi:dihydroorotate dehydrogenase (fumarate)
MFKDFPLNVSVAKTNSKECASDKEAIKDYCDSLLAFDKLKQVRMLEINISCPNTYGGEPFTTPERLEQLLKSVDALKLKKPVFVKMPISMAINKFDALLAVIARHNVAGVCVGNLLKDRSKAQLKDELPKEVKGGLSGEPNREITTELVRYAYQKYGNKLIIVGIGGVMNAEDAYEKIRAGASLVALITGLMFEGPQIVGEINEGLTRLLKRDNFSTISEAVGVDADKKAV